MEKTCERCGRRFTRAEVAADQSLKHWAKRRFCSSACQVANAADWNRERAGERSPNWKGDSATPSAGRKRARAKFRDEQPCEVCDARAERHHIDGNTLNNDSSNIAWLCRQHHIDAEDRAAFRRRLNKTPEQREREREYQRRYRLRKKGLLPPPPPPKGSEEQRARGREATRRYRARKRAQQNT